MESISFGGDGVLRTDGMVVFVPLTVPGDDVEIELVDVKKTFARGKLQAILKPSEHRVSPPCAYFGTCGGCQLQHVAYEKQLEIKRMFVKDALERIGKIRGVEVKPTVAANPIWHYRRHIRLRPNDPDYVHLEKCLIFSDKELSEFEPIHREGEVLLFKPERSFDVEGLHFAYSDKAFVQAHPSQSARLYRDLTSMLLDTKPKRVLDLYCGIGVTSLLIAKQGIETLGVEGNPEAIRLARVNQAHNSVANVSWQIADVDDVVNSMVKKYEPDSIIVNPPRTGLNKPVLEALERSNALNIFYVSCMPSTLARDLAKLIGAGYTIESCQPYDMFPQTTHVETCVHLRK